MRIIKLHGLGHIRQYLTVEKTRLLNKEFIDSLLNYTPLIWMLRQMTLENSKMHLIKICYDSVSAVLFSSDIRGFYWQKFTKVWFSFKWYFSFQLLGQLILDQTLYKFRITLTWNQLPRSPKSTKSVIAVKIS